MSRNYTETVANLFDCWASEWEQGVQNIAANYRRCAQELLDQSIYPDDRLLIMFVERGIAFHKAIHKV